MKIAIARKNKDIELYLPKLKDRGIMAGHDINNQGVFRAVSKFAVKNNIDIQTKKFDWWFIKR